MQIVTELYLYRLHLFNKIEVSRLDSTLSVFVIICTIQTLSEATPQMQRLLLLTIPCDMTVEYIKGETNFIADYLSKAPVAKDTIKLPILQMNQITAHTRCKQDRIDRL